jgi:hypothetical protein
MRLVLVLLSSLFLTACQSSGDYSNLTVGRGGGGLGPVKAAGGEPLAKPPLPPTSQHLC